MKSKSSILSLHFITILVLNPSCKTQTWDKFVGSLKDEKAAIGFSARIRCPTSHSLKSPIKWFKDNVEVTDNRTTILENGDLLISNVQFTDQGEYMCNAQNSLTTTVSSIKKLIVQPPTQILELNTTDHEVTEGDQIGFKCVVLVTSLSTLQELKIIWLHNGTVIDYKSEVQRFRKVIKSFVLVSDSWIIENTTVLDTGKYTCFVSTSLDNATAEKQLVVLPKEQVEEQSQKFVSAEAVRYLKASQLSSSTFYLSWEKPGIMVGTLVGYNIFYQDVNEAGPNSVRGRFKNITDFYPTSIILNNLKENTKYKIFINAVTTAGSGETSSIEKETNNAGGWCLCSTVLYVCSPAFSLVHSHEQPSSEYGSPKNETVTMVWEPWANCIDKHFSNSVGSYFYIKYRAIDQFCFDEIFEFNEEYVFIPNLYFNKKYQFIVGYVDGEHIEETQPIYLEFFPKSIQILPRKYVESFGAAPSNNVSTVVQILIIMFGFVYFICGCFGILICRGALMVHLDNEDDPISIWDSAESTKLKIKQCCSDIMSCSAVIALFIISMFWGFTVLRYVQFVVLTYEPSSDVLCFRHKSLLSHFKI